MLLLALMPQRAVAIDPEQVLLAEQRAIARINLAARQRYFVQKVAKSGCFALTEFNPQENAAAAMATITRFDDAFEVLITGDASQGIAPEADQATIDTITAAAPNWQTFRAATQQIVSGDWHSVPMAQVLRLNPVVLGEVNGAVDQIVAVHSNDLATQKAYSATVNIAGRQRMLVQKAAKEMCFVWLQITPDIMRERLAETIALFETSLFALENGDFDMSVIDPPSLAVLIKISEIRALWDQYRAPLAAVAEGGTPGRDDVAFVEENSADLYQMSDALVQLYVKK